MRGRVKVFLPGLALLCACALGCSAEPDAAAKPSAPFAQATADFDAGRAFADLRRQVRIGPRVPGTAGGRREVRLIRRRLRTAGVENVTVQRPWRNVVARIPGRKRGTMLIGAHHDTKDSIPGFLGANDGASGVAVLLEIARVMPERLPGRSLTLVFFDAEETRGDRPFLQDGIRGSRQFVRYAGDGARQGSPRLGSMRGLYLLDMVGDCDLRIPREGNSSPGLYARLQGPPFGGSTDGLSDDHIPFREAGVPAVDVIDFDYGPGPRPGAWWHTPQDTLDKVCPSSLEKAGTAVVRALGTL
jgi:glutaminyl-peptide cyclotransferase